jgi:adenylate cyclase
VRNFTKMSERLAPTADVGFLNTPLNALSRHVTANEGTLDKFIGDSFMAFWNAPLNVDDHTRKAVRAALAMRETLARLNAEDALALDPSRRSELELGYTPASRAPGTWEPNPLQLLGRRRFCKRCFQD